LKPAASDRLAERLVELDEADAHPGRAPLAELLEEGVGGAVEHEDELVGEPALLELPGVARQDLLELDALVVDRDDDGDVALRERLVAHGAPPSSGDPAAPPSVSRTT
jgi:hypothetical protein